MHEYVVDDHGKTSLLANSALMRRETLAARPQQAAGRLKCEFSQRLHVPL